MNIGGVDIGSGWPPIVVAEMSGNHNRSLRRAIEIVNAVAEAGCQMLKLQTYTADTITLDVNDDEFVITEKDSLWVGRSFHSLYQEAHTPWEWQKEIIEHANTLGLVCFSSVFDKSSVEFLERLDVPAYKIASQECIHLPLIKEVAETGKPIVMSTGMATLAEIDEAINLIKKTSSSEVLLMKCTSSYPANPANSNILTIPKMKEIFGCEIGLSDHTLGVGAAIAAVAHGATMVEKHFTLNRDDGGVDSAFSLEPQEMRNLVQEAERAWQSLGGVKFGPTDAEISSLSGRRSIYISEDMAEGDELTVKNIRVIRPNSGLMPKFYDMVMGRKINRDVKKGTPLRWGLIR